MKKKPTVVESQRGEFTALVDVLERMLSNEQTRQLLADPGVRVVVTTDRVTGRVNCSFRSADYTDEDAPPA